LNIDFPPYRQTVGKLRIAWRYSLVLIYASFISYSWTQNHLSFSCDENMPWDGEMRGSQAFQAFFNCGGGRRCSRENASGVAPISCICVQMRKPSSLPLTLHSVVTQYFGCEDRGVNDFDSTLFLPRALQT
jgi:hypothetical protein